ncbi:MAG: hypothetical protein N3F05_01595, partial [Candidatus Diapherotrites archaeon]|nr:hypothetical protein [Candidatus Diapherotrites archaeon]
MKALKVFVAVILVFLFYFCFAETRVYPYVEMSVKPKAVDVNEPMLITITGYDNYDIEMISLYYNGVWHDYECKGIQKECSNTWEVRQKTPGSYLYHAYAIDNVGIYTPKLVSIRATVYEERADYFEAAVGNKKSIEVNKKFEEDGYYYYDLNIGKPIYSMTIKATVRFRQENGYARFVLRGSDGKEYLIYEIYPLVSKYNYVEVSGICEETCALNGIIPQTIKIQNAYADVYLKEINYAESPGLISEGAYKASFVTHVEKLKHGQQIAKMETASQNMKNKGAYWVAGITQLAITPYQEKKKIFGGEVPVFYGAEYSLYGTFQLPEPKRACECAEDSECSGGQTCDGCNCKSNEVKCEITDYYCEGDVLYWKDSCGNKGIQSDCGAGGGVCEGKNCVIKQPPCQKKTCASYYDVKCGTLDDGCNGTITCPNNCGPDKECQTVLGEGNCIPKAVQPKPPANCPGCYQTVEECKAANGGGLTSRCKCKEGVYCEFDTTCNCYKYSSCTESVCGGGGCTLKSCAVEYKGKCGTFPDGCGGELKCECPSGQTCNNETGLCEGTPSGNQGGGSGGQQPICADSDGGKDIYTKGVVEYNGNYYPDMCSSSGGIIEHYCETSASGCDTNSVKYYQSSCPTGYRCIDGACQKDTGQPSTCTDSDMGRNYYVRGTTTDPKGSYIDKCSADGKTLYEYYCVWDNAQMEENPTPYDYICKDGAFVEANPSSNCSDSDGGRDIYKKGTVNENGILSTDECTCGGSKVKEYSCSKGRTVVAEEYCPTGYTCKDGACVQGSSPEVCNDSDGGKNFDAKGTVVFGGQTYVDFCNGSVVNEHYCESNQGRSTTYNCPYGCSDGACLSSSYGSGTRGKCTDSDGGINGFVRGTVEYQSTMAIILRDYCQDNKSVKEYFCQNDEPLETIVPCPDICENGACKTSSSSGSGSGTRGKCTDSDGGINGFVRGTVEYQSTMAIILRDYCQDNKSVKEYFCQND